MLRRHFIAGMAVATSAGWAARAAEGQFPSRALRIVVPFAAGGPTDVIARVISDAMSARWGVPIVVDNKPGAGTILGTAEVARSPADGYTLGFVISAHTINPAVRKKLPYDTLRDFRGVTQVGEGYIVLAANSAFPADDLDGFIQAARTAKEPLAYATPGVGTATHLAGELLQRAAQIKLLHVQYNGSAPALTDVLSNRVPLIFDIWHSVQQHVQSGQLKVIGVTNASPIPTAPQYRCIGEKLPGYEANSIFGLVVPAQTPDDIVRKLSDDLAAYLRSAAFAEKARELGIVPVGSTPEQFDALIRQQIGKWRDIAATTGISIAE